MPTADVQRVVIVGGGLAAAKTAEALRAEGYAGSIVLFAAERHIPYDRPPLSKAFLKGEQSAEDGDVLPESWYAEHDVDLRIGTAVTSIDADAHEVLATDGSRTAYDKLVLATGASPRRSDLPGADLGGVLYLRTVEDSEKLREAFQKDAKIVIVGGGWIGLEAASAAREAGADVTVLEMAEQPLMAVLGPALGRSFADLHREHGVDLRTGVQVTEIVGKDGAVVGVRLGDGSLVEADAVVVGIGAAPNTGLAESAGLRVDDGVRVDEHLRSSDPRIYAAGDIASIHHPALGRQIRVEHWATAQNSGPVAAAAMIDENAAGWDRLPYFFTDQYDLGMEYTGHVDPGDENVEVVVRGDLPGREFIAFWLKDGRLLAGMNVNIWDVTDDIERLIRAGTTLDTARLADPGVPLSDL